MRYKGFVSVVLVLSALLGLSALYSCALQEGGQGLQERPLPMRAEGRPNFHPGLPASYWIWHDRGGWHLRVTAGGGVRHQFQGTVESSGGFIEGFRATRLEWTDRAMVEGRRVIRFNLLARGDMDGFDWQSSTNCNIFNLSIDGMPGPERVFVGAFSENPPTTAFEACP